MIKVAQCLAGAPFGGAENFYTRLTVALAGEPGLEQRAFTRKNNFRVPQLESAGVPVETFRFGGSVHWYENYKYRRALKKFRPNVVLTYMNRATQLTPKGDYQLVARLGHYYKLKYYRHADHWIAVSKGIQKYLVENGIPKERIVYIPNFADEGFTSYIPRNSFSTPVDKPLLLSAGRLHVNKAFDVLFQALTKIPDAILWLAGDGPEKEALVELAIKLKISGRVKFLGWRNDVTSLMRTADMFICPSRHEGLGSIVVESWRHGCPIVATASQGPSDLIEDDRTGLMSPVDNVQLLQENICRLIDDPKLGGKLVTRGRQEYQSKYSREVIVKQYSDFFQRIGK